MAILDSATGKVRKQYSIPELQKAANLMRGYDLVALAAAGSGHAGGTLSIMDIAAALYLRVLEHDPVRPDWSDRDRVFWSAGHKAPALYLALGFSGYFDPTEVATLRKLTSPFQGHPHSAKLPGVEVSSGSLGQGLSVAVGAALAAKLDNKAYRVFCLMGDGEQQEGNIWEAAMEAGHFGLNNLVAVVDCNRLQIDGPVAQVMNVEPLADKYAAFGWEVTRVDGHNMADVVWALENARNTATRPTVILAATVKGKGVSFMENIAGWHGKSPNHDEMVRGLEELRVKDEVPYGTMLARAQEFQKNIVEPRLEERTPKYSRDYWWNATEITKVAMEPTRKGFGAALAEHGDDERVVCLGLDISGSITISDFYAKNPERKKRWLSFGIAEQSATAAAAGLARAGKLPVFGTYATFAAARNLDQVRVSVCYPNLNVMIAGAHGGVSVGPDGATHQALEDLFAMCGLPNMTVAVPCDSIETKKATETLLLRHDGPKYIRFAREATPVVTTLDTPFVIGRANVVRLRDLHAPFLEAFETRLANELGNEHEDLSIVACGPMVPEAMRAAVILKREFGYETRILNLHTLKPMDEESVLRAAAETNLIVTAEEHQIGALSGRVSSVLTSSPELYGKRVLTGAIGVQDRFGDSGAPWELVKEFGVSGEHIALKALELLSVAGKKPRTLTEATARV